VKKTSPTIFQWLSIVFTLALVGHSVFGATTNVSYGNFFFNPPIVTITAGDTVVWTQTGGGHSVTGTGADPMCGDVNVTTCTVTFTQAGSYPYKCRVHVGSQNMTGLVVVVSRPVASLQWRGTPGTWDSGTSTNWLNLGTGASDRFYTNDTVLFDDTATGTTTVSLATALYPASTTISNITKSYTFIGSGKISSGSITKNGTGTLTISNANDSTGSVSINGGILKVGNSNALGTNNAIVVASSATLDVSAVSGFNFVSGQALSGSGTVTGAVKIAGGATVSPGTSSLATLTFRNSLTLQGTAAMQINKSGVTLTSDKIAVVANPLTNGGTLTVTASGDALTGGESFDLFDASSVSGSFAATNLPALTGGLNWWLGNLATDGTLLVNRAPTANLATYTRAPNITLKMLVSNLLTNASDADAGNILTLQSVGSGTNNATVTISGGYIFYQPSSTDPNRNTDDHLSYTVSDGRGGTASSQIWIKVGDPNSGNSGAGISGITALGNGHMLVKFRGIPGYAYRVQQTTNLSGQSTVWTSIGAATELPANSGYFEFEDANPPGGQAYYRTVWP
jgi:autotransporter-associated beta strand protein